MSENETIADIVAALRKCSDEWIGDMSFVSMGGAGCFASYLADHLEAAWKRERETVTDCNHLGNAAAMREALEKIGAMEVPHNFQVERCDIVDACYDLTHAIRFAKSALSAPARNCDRPECATSKAAQDVWRREDGGRTPYYEWLFAPAAERKGEVE